MGANDAKAELFDEVSDARRDLLDVLEDLPIEAWDRSTLCEGWRVRDVVAHVALAPDVRGRGLRSLVLRGRERRDLAADAAARAGGDRDVSQILTHFRDNVESRSVPAGMTSAQLLTDVVVHSLDICKPNGWDLELPVDRIRLALSTMVHGDRLCGGRQRAEGLHFDTTDIDWRAGCGDHVRGPSQVMLLALAGRRPVCSELSGDGVAILIAR